MQEIILVKHDSMEADSSYHSTGFRSYHGDLERRDLHLEEEIPSMSNKNSLEEDDEASLEHAVSELRDSLTRHSKKLSRTQVDFFEWLIASSGNGESTKNGNSVYSGSTDKTTGSVSSLRKASKWIQETESDEGETSTETPPASKRDSKLSKDLWRYHAKGIAPKTLIRSGSFKRLSKNKTPCMPKALMRRSISAPAAKKEGEPCAAYGDSGSIDGCLLKTASFDEVVGGDVSSPPRSGTPSSDDPLTPRVSNRVVHTTMEQNADWMMNWAAQGAPQAKDLLMPIFSYNEEEEEKKMSPGSNQATAVIDSMDLFSATESTITQKDLPIPPPPLSRTSSKTSKRGHRRVKSLPDSTMLNKPALIRESSSGFEAIQEFAPFETTSASPFITAKHRQHSPIFNASFGDSTISTIGYQSSFMDSFGSDAGGGVWDSFSSIGNPIHPLSSIKRDLSIASDFSVPSLHRCNAVEESDTESLYSNLSTARKHHRRIRSMPAILHCDSFDEGDEDEEECSPSLADDLTEGSQRSVKSSNNYSGPYNPTSTITIPTPSASSTSSSNPALLLTNHNRSVTFDSKLTLDSKSWIEDDSDTIPTDVSLRPSQEDDTASWEVRSDDHFYDAWDVLHDEYFEDELPFEILGTSGEDVSAQPHVLSPPLMDSLVNFLPERLVGQNWWLKYSLVRDGASLRMLLRNVRGSRNTLLAIETTSGHVFGSFTSEPWRKNWGYFGTGESFVWKMRRNRLTTPCYSVLDQAKLESEIEVFVFTGQNDMVQACRQGLIAVGGGLLEDDQDRSSDLQSEGFALAINEDLLQGTTSPCATFSSPCLTTYDKKDGDIFEIVNLEMWTFTPCMNEEEAERNELGKLFMEDHPDLNVIGILVGAR